MCGICGFAGRADDALVNAMTQRLDHRGPDGWGTRSFPSIDGGMPASLGHRRLSILDPTPRGAQPMVSSSGRYWITYNGEIYNFRELRANLEREGSRFRSDCDTEVVLAMYVRYGADMLARLNGIFAMAIWDEERGRLFLARDRLGVKPLYYAQDNDTLYFASEVKALLPALPRPSLRRDVVAEYLTFLWVPDPDTMFDGIQKLAPGHYATFSGRRLELTQYWDMTFAPEPRPESEWAEAVRDGVQAAVRRQMVSDVPVGSFLSGGIDSSAIVAEMCQVTDRVTTFTVGAGKQDLEHEIIPDDVRYARRIAARYPVDYHERVLEANVVELLPKLVWQMDEPVADPAAISTYLICSAARERLTVILSGMGGDEIFAGYPRHLAARLGRGFEPVPVALRRRLRALIEARLTLGRPGRLRGPRRNLMKLARGLDASPWERYLAYCSYYQVPELAELLGEDTPLRDPFARHRSYLERVRGEHWLNQLLYLDMKTFLPCLNLTYTDKMSMAAGAEVRVPLLDNELVDLSARIPAELKLHGLTRKYVFKRSMEGVLPREIIYRRKAGFGAPVRSWLVGELQPMVDELLSPEVIRQRGLFEPTEVRRLVAANHAGREDNALRIWALLTLELWQRAFLDADRRHENGYHGVAGGAVATRGGMEGVSVGIEAFRRAGGARYG
ncbi:MAG: asparagine synthase (glutamine-hydrolyzing) [Solirubrobacterales bacterium]|nr:asparagine synthase (glutamine-hydrolyzing) [Solirubrobacterales bacterium]